MKTHLFLAAVAVACLASAQDVWKATAVDEKIYHWPTNPPVRLYREVRNAVPGAEGQVSGFKLPALPKAETNEAPALLSLAWDPAPMNGSNGVAKNFLLLLSEHGELPVLVLTTNTMRADTADVPGTYFVSAINQYGESKLSAGLVYPKPSTNVYTLWVNVTNWLPQVWQVPNLPAAQQYFALRYTPTNGAWRVSCVFAGNRTTPMDAWQTFVPWTPFITGKTNVALDLRKETF